MKIVKNNTQLWEIVHPVGTKIRWVQTRREREYTETHVVKGYGRCGSFPTGCHDCDGINYIVEEDRSNRCHYRNEESSYGLGYWERIE